MNELGRRRGAVPSFVGLSIDPRARRRGSANPGSKRRDAGPCGARCPLRGGLVPGGGHGREPGHHAPDGQRTRRPLVVEAALGSSLRAATGLGETNWPDHSGVLLGGYGGAWVSVDLFRDLPVSEKDARSAGATLGAGVIVRLPRDVCPLAEMADVVRYMESQGAGQCGPCVHGLAELGRMRWIGWPTADRADPTSTASSRPASWWRGGAPAATLTALPGSCVPVSAVFADEVASHQRRGSCPRTQAARVLPVAGRTADETVGEPGMSRRRLELVLDPVACDGRGVCAEMLPERIELDRWGYPVIDDAEWFPPSSSTPYARCGRARSRPCTWWSDVLSPREISSPTGASRSASRWSASPLHRRRRRVLAVVGAVLAVLFLWLAISHRRRAHQSRPGKFDGCASRRVVPWPRWGVRRRLGRERVVLPPPAKGGWRPRRRDHSQAQGDPHARPRRRRDRTCRRLRPSRRSPAHPLPARASGRRSGGWSTACPRSTRRCSGPMRSTRATSWGSPGWTPSSSRPRCTRAAQIPGGGPFTHTAPISPTDSTDLVAAFNAGFLMSDANGGYYTDNKTIIPLRTGRGLVRGLQERIVHRRAMGA